METSWLLLAKLVLNNWILLELADPPRFDSTAILLLWLGTGEVEWDSRRAGIALGTGVFLRLIPSVTGNDEDDALKSAVLEPISSDKDPRRRKAIG